MSKLSFPAINKGFTLLEVLLAIVITALIGLGSWQLLNSAIRTNELTHARLEELKQLQKAMFFVARDFQQLLARSIRDEYGDLLPALSTRNEFYALEFTRSGWRNPLQDPRSELQRVAYELDQEGWLVRHYWPVLDRAQDTEPRSRKLLKGAKEVRFAFLNESGSWVDEWPPELDGEEPSDALKKYNQLPKALRIELEHPRFGQVARLFDLAQYLDHSDIVSVDGDGESDEEVDGSSNPNDDTGSGGSGNRTSVGSGSAEEVRE